MTDSLATKQDLLEMNARIDVRFAKVDDRFAYLEKHMDTRFAELEKRSELRLDSRLADLERRMTMRLGGVTVAAIGVVSALSKLL